MGKSSRVKPLLNSTIEKKEVVPDLLCCMPLINYKYHILFFFEEISIIYLEWISINYLITVCFVIRVINLLNKSGSDLFIKKKDLDHLWLFYNCRLIVSVDKICFIYNKKINISTFLTQNKSSRAGQIYIRAS